MVGDGSSGRVFGSASEPLPPALTQTNHRGAMTPDPVLAPPFVPGFHRTIAAAGVHASPPDSEGSGLPAEEAVLSTDALAEGDPVPPEEATSVSPSVPEALTGADPTVFEELTAANPGAETSVEPAAEELLLEPADPFAGDPDALPEPMAWEQPAVQSPPWDAPAVEPMPWDPPPAESMPWDAPVVEPMPWEAEAERTPWSSIERSDPEVEGVVEPAFGEDLSSTTDGILASTPEDEFPIDAFIIPEHAKRVPTGVPDPDHANHTDPSHELAERFEMLSRRLRAEDIESLLPSLARGDRFDALVAGFIAGYFSARDL